MLLTNNLKGQNNCLFLQSTCRPALDYFLYCTKVILVGLYLALFLSITQFRLDEKIIFCGSRLARSLAPSVGSRLTSIPTDSVDFWTILEPQDSANLMRVIRFIAMSVFNSLYTVLGTLFKALYKWSPAFDCRKSKSSTDSLKLAQIYQLITKHHLLFHSSTEQVKIQSIVTKFKNTLDWLKIVTWIANIQS